MQNMDRQKQHTKGQIKRLGEKEGGGGDRVSWREREREREGGGRGEYDFL